MNNKYICIKKVVLIKDKEDSFKKNTKRRFES